ncbi:hypothetical protein ACJ5H2_13595 [Nocardioides sp. R1-1]|uniref:hypothetical protein n=1 Tax=Nocardioides sp. R1-1 TaxID=3383502 RepID=UPI0038D2256B
MVADFRREYHMSAAELACLSLQEFHTLLIGLSSRSRFAREWADKPKTLHDPAERAALREAALR